MEKMFFISVDIEGITDVTAWSETEYGKEGYESACEQMTREAAAACKTVMLSGNRAIVRDGHGNARNIKHMGLPEGTELMRGWACHPGSMMAGIDESFSGAIYIGYHAPAGSDGSPLAHTVDFDKVKWIRINGRLASEFTLNSLYAASVGVPSIFLSGDETICRMAKEEMPQISTLAVKSCCGNSTLNIHPMDAVKQIESTLAVTVADFLQNPEKYTVPILPEKLILEVCLTTHQSVKAASLLSGVELVDDFTVRYTAKTPGEMNVAFDFIRG